MKIDRRDFLVGSGLSLNGRSCVGQRSAEGAWRHVRTADANKADRKTAVYTTAKGHRKSSFTHRHSRIQTTGPASRDAQTCVSFGPVKTVRDIIGIGGALTQRIRRNYAKLPPTNSKNSSTMPTSTPPKASVTRSPGPTFTAATFQATARRMSKRATRRSPRSMSTMIAATVSRSSNVRSRRQGTT